jgi:hypothetical protein
MFSIMTTLFVLMLAILQSVVPRISRCCRVEQHPNAYRDALDLTEEPKAEFGAQVDDMSAADIEAEIGGQTEHRGKIAIETENLPL